ncbi:MAG: beta-lactamase family protein [Gammaproteobacteria bacterium]|nr:beta-lactamase family protein [Gammaproteobacteria bacterium]
MIKDLEQSISQFIKQKQSEFHIPGIAFVLVKDGKVLLSKGYGYANLETQQKVDPQKNLFRVASVSKIFTVVALLQLAEQGKIDLNAQTNHYLSSDEFKIKSRFDKPQLIKHLLTHTDGFEERLVGANALRLESLMPLKELLKRQLKPLFTAPGERICYGSAGMALISYLVEKISGTPFPLYVEQNIFKPLSMQHSMMHQNFSDQEKQQLAAIYNYQNGQYTALPITFSTSEASGGACVIPDEMAHFLTAILDQSENPTFHLLKSDSIRQMFERQFSSLPDLSGVTYGFFEHEANGIRTLIRDGSGFSINSRIALWPEHRMGYFVVTNKASAAFVVQLSQHLSDYFFPSKPQQIEKKISGPTQNIQEFAGHYEAIQYARYSISKVFKLFFNQLKVTVKNQDTLLISPVGYDPFSELQGTTEWKNMKSGIFSGLTRKGIMGFLKQGKIMYLFSGIFYHSSYSKMPWYKKPALHLYLFKIFAIILFLLAGLGGLGFTLQEGILRLIFGLASISCLGSAIFTMLIIPLLCKKGLINGMPSFVYLDAPKRYGLQTLLTIPFINIAMILGLVGVIIFGGVILNQSFFTYLYFISFFTMSGFYFWFIKYWNLWRIRVC